MSISKIFIPNSLRVFSQIKDRKHIEQNFHSVARVMPRGVTCGCWGESKTLGWGFAMAPHRLRTLVRIIALGRKWSRPGGQLFYIGLFRENMKNTSCLKPEGLDY